jgi:hypothetical protein
MAFGDLGVRRGAAVTGAVAALAMISGCQSDRTSPPPATTARGPLIVAPTACADFTVSIYFASGSASIDRAGEALLAAAGARAARCSVTGVKVRGLADAPGGHDVEFQVSAIGDAPVESPGGDIHLLRRRVDLEIHLAAP